MLRSALCVAMLAMCLAASQCTASEVQGDTEDVRDVSRPGVGPNGSNGATNLAAPAGAPPAGGVGGLGGGADVLPATTTTTQAGSVVAQGDQVSSQITTTTTTTENKASGVGASGGLKSGVPGVSGPTGVSGPADVPGHSAGGSSSGSAGGGGVEAGVQGTSSNLAAGKGADKGDGGGGAGSSSSPSGAGGTGAHGSPLPATSHSGGSSISSGGGPGGSGGNELSGPSSTSGLARGVDAAGFLSLSGAAISRGGGEDSGDPPSRRPQSGSGVNAATTATKAVTPGGQEKVPSTDASGVSSGPKGDALAPQIHTPKGPPIAKPTATQSTAHATSGGGQTPVKVPTATPSTSSAAKPGDKPEAANPGEKGTTLLQTLKFTTSTAVPTDSTQALVNSTTESAKGESTAQGNPLPKLSKTLQSVDKKDSIIGISSLLAFSALVTLVVMAVAPAF